MQLPFAIALDGTPVSEHVKQVCDRGDDERYQRNSNKQYSPFELCHMRSHKIHTWKCRLNDIKINFNFRFRLLASSFFFRLFVFCSTRCGVLFTQSLNEISTREHKTRSNIKENLQTIQFKWKQ